MHEEAINHKLAVDKNLKTKEINSAISMQSNVRDHIEKSQYMKPTKENYCIAKDMDYVHCNFNKQTSHIYNYIKGEALKSYNKFPFLTYRDMLGV